MSVAGAGQDDFAVRQVGSKVMFRGTIAGGTDIEVCDLPPQIGRPLSEKHIQVVTENGPALATITPGGKVLADHRGGWICFDGAEFLLEY